MQDAEACRPWMMERSDPLVDEVEFKGVFIQRQRGHAGFIAHAADRFKGVGTALGGGFFPEHAGIHEP